MLDTGKTQECVTHPNLISNWVLDIYVFLVVLGKDSLFLTIAFLCKPILSQCLWKLKCPKMKFLNMLKMGENFLVLFGFK